MRTITCIKIIRSTSKRCLACLGRNILEESLGAVAWTTGIVVVIIEWSLSCIAEEGHRGLA